MSNNIITAAYSSSNITYTKPAYQYDYGMILKFSGIELPQAYEVHFSNTEFCGESISQIGDSDGVTIPDEMFLSGNPIYAWTFLHTGEDDGETVYKAVIGINKRAQPSNLEPTPVQQDAITQAIAALNVAVEQTAQDVIDAGAAATAAETAQGLAEDARDAAVVAQGEAEDAQEAAETAQGKAEDAQEAAERAAGSVLGLTADATVDANVGTPSVEVEVTTESDHKNMTFTFKNLKGVQGDPGVPGVGISSVVLNYDYTLTITLTNGTSYTTSSIRGEVGATPNLTIGTVSTLPEGSQATATITGTYEDPVLSLGIPVGDTGDPGISPTITVTEITGGHNIEITDAQGTTDFDVMDGQSGLITDYVAEEKTPYLFRTSANGLANVISEKDMILGGTVAWNQQLKEVNSENYGATSSSATVSFSDGVATVTASEQYKGIFNYSGNRPSIPNGHNVLCSVEVKLSSAVSNAIKAYWNEQTSIAVAAEANTNWQTLSSIIKWDSSKNPYVRVVDYRSSGWDSYLVRNFQLFDLTQMFGSTIADYIYSLGSVNGIAKLKEWGFLTKSYYPYNGGDLLSVQTSAHVMRDADDNVIGNYPLDSDLVLRGTLKLDENNNLYYDGDTYKWDGSVTRKYGIVDLGTLTWTYVTSDTVFYASIPDKRDGLATVRCGSRYMPGGLSGYSTSDYLIGQSSNASLLKRIFISDPTYTTASDFKASLSGVYLIYELATPTTESADPYSEYQIVDADGTEEYVDERTVPIPVGHDTYYQQALDVPQLPTADGAYQLNLTKVGNTAVASWGIISQTSMVASANIQNGKYFNIGEKLYLATRAISQGETIVVGTNCSEVSLADALNQINA